MEKNKLTNVGDLSEELLTEVLARLPIKTLLVCKSVSKPWLSHISDPNFINSHLHYIINNNNNDNNPTLLDILDPSSVENVSVMPFNQGTYALPDVLYFMNLLSQSSLRTKKCVLETLLDAKGDDWCGRSIHFYRVVIPNVFRSFQVVGTSCCNGIVCLRDGNVVYLWNPLIRRCKEVRVPQLDVDSLSGVKIGFGYDSTANDYKVFRTLSEGNLDSVTLKLQVYSANADSWREYLGPVRGGKLREEKFEESDFVVVKEILYFSSWNEQQLIAFDLRKEVFGLVPFPSFVQKKWSNVLDFKGSIAVVFESGSGIDLWTLDDNVSGQGSSWTKIFNIAPDHELNLWLSCYLGAGKFYGKELPNGNEVIDNVLYDCEKKETKYYGVGVENILATLKYTETLVSLDGFHQVEENGD